MWQRSFISNGRKEAEKGRQKGAREKISPGTHPYKATYSR
jgi:hypothetical protein